MFLRSRILRQQRQRPQRPYKKDFHFPGYHPADPRKRIAILIDAEMLSVEDYFKKIQKVHIKAALQNPNVLLHRVFAHTLKPDWQQLVINSSNRRDEDDDDNNNHHYNCNRDDGDTTTFSGGGDGTIGPAFDAFKVERFISMHMQVTADAGHIAQLRLSNKVQGIVICCEVPVAPLYVEQLRKRSIFDLVDRYVVTEEGFAMREELSKKNGMRL